MKPILSAICLLILSVISGLPVIGADRQPGVYGNKASSYGSHFMSQRREMFFRGLFPPVDDSEINSVLSDPDLILYTDEEVPLARQDWTSVSSGLHSILYDISGGDDHIGQGSAHEFPWKKPAGTHRIPDSELIEVRGLLLPRSDGRPLPIAYYRLPQESHLDRDIGRANKIEWVYPHGTVFLELLARQLPNGSVVPFELRARVRERGEWSVDVFRPYPTRKSLNKALSRLGESQLSNNPQVREVRLHDGYHRDLQEIDVIGNVEQLPRYPADKVERLLSGKTFHSVLGQSWSSQADVPAGGINPDQYRAVMDVDRESCMVCHRSTNKHASLFDTHRDWYGNVRGSDAIISFHIFDPSCVSMNGTSKPVAYRRELVEWGFLEPYSRDKHSPDFYSALE